MKALALTALLALVAAAGAGARDEAVTRTPQLRLLDLAPLTVRGSGFRAGERVKLVATADRLATRNVQAGARGGFTVRFDLRAGPCTAAVVQAFGRAGSRASVDRPTPDCLEP